MVYQILGYPRSRTAWLAAFLTTENSFCFHEGVGNLKERRLRTIPEYRKLIKLYSEHYEHVGDANTVALLRQKYIIPGAKIVIIERDKSDVEGSLYALGFYADIPEVIEYPYNEYITVKFEEIDNKLDEIWDFCLPGIKYQSARAKLFKQMNIQVKNPYDYVNFKGV